MNDPFGVYKSAPRDALEITGGTSAVVGAANVNQGFEGYNNARKKINNKRNKRAEAKIKGLKAQKYTPNRKAATKKLYGKIANNNRKTNIAVKRLGYKSRVGTAATGFLVGYPLAWHGARELVEKSQTKRQKKVDAAFAGGASGAGGYQLGLYATKPIDRKFERDIKTKADTMKGSDPANPRTKLNEHQRKMKLPKNSPVGHKQWLPYFRKYPKGVPGWRFKRAMSYAHAGKTGVAATVGAGAVGAGIGLANTKEKK